MKSDRNLQKINKYFRLNKNEFWSKLNKLGRANININIPINVLKNHYFGLFNSTNNIDSESNVRNANDLEYNLRRERRAFYSLDPITLKNLIDGLASGKAYGMSGISYEHIKHCTSNKLLTYLSSIYHCFGNNDKIFCVF